MIGIKDWIKIGPNVRSRYRKHIFVKALDVNDAKFKDYSTNPSKWVTMSVKPQFKKLAPKEGYSYKDAKRGNMLKRQSSQYAGTTAPVLTEDLLKDFGTIYSASDKGFKMGWSSYGHRVEHLRKKGRVLTSKNKALPDGVVKYLEQQIDTAIDENTNKALGGGKTTTHKVGKK